MRPITPFVIPEAPASWASAAMPARHEAAAVQYLNAPLLRSLNVAPEDFGAQLLSLIGESAEAAGLQPVALAYAGHQFGQFVPTLGDGRAHLIGEMKGADGRRLDVQLKGSGRTLYSRGGDGRATLGAVLREVLLGECFAALGIPTTRGAAVLVTGEAVPRTTIKPGAILVRVAASHLRVGSFQYYAARGDRAAIDALALAAIRRHDPDLEHIGAERVIRWLERVIGRQADLIARWMSVGFIHGVMNTDNMALSGETIDYGPCAFLDHYHPGQVFSSIDHRGRYAFGNQPQIALWNLARFAETILPLLDADEAVAVRLAEDALDGFAERYSAAYAQLYGQKMGLGDVQSEDALLIADLLSLMQTHRTDFTLGFRALCEAPLQQASLEALRRQFGQSAEADAWIRRWQDRLATTGESMETIAARMRGANPVVIARNHLVEAAITAAEDHGDFSVFQKLVIALATPFSVDPADAALACAPTAEQVVQATFCGT
jgi:uncharacterized protein YdiU (UPF0061 family)